MRILALALVSFLVAGQARAADTAADQFAKFLTDKVKEGRLVVLVSPYYKPAYEAYIPVWTFAAQDPATGKPSKDPMRRYFSLGGGGRIDMEDKTHASGFVGCDLNLVALSARLWDFAWARGHLDRSSFPPIYAGPAFEAPTSYEQLRTMTLKRDLRAQFGISYPYTALQTSSPNTP
jgi:hypothetical protein